MDSLINQLIPLKPASNSSLMAAQNNRVIEAVVVASVRTPATSIETAQYKISVDTGQQLLELSTQSSVPTGTKIVLKLADNNLAHILQLDKPDAKLQAKNLAHQQLPSTTAPHKAALNGLGIGAQKSYAAQHQSILEQGIREALPKQQTLHQLASLLQTLSQQEPINLPKSLLKNINQLLKQFSTAQQLQQPHHLKQAINNSGIFFEAKLAQTLSASTSNTQARSANPAIAQDLKGLFQKFLPLIAAINTNNADSSTSSDQQPPLYSNLAAQPSSTTASPAQTSNDSGKNLDIMLRLLSDQLLASIARTQVNQMESLTARQANTADGQGPINSWNLELPIFQGKYIDNLGLNIEQHLIDDPLQQDSNKQQQKLWVVMLDFDLHNLGKMNVQLKILNDTIAATVWSEQEKTHYEVKQQVQQLKKNLEKVGVKVRQLECQLGSPPKNTLPIYQQLVDVHT